MIDEIGDSRWNVYGCDMQFYVDVGASSSATPQNLTQPNGLGNAFVSRFPCVIRLMTLC